MGIERIAVMQFVIERKFMYCLDILRHKLMTIEGLCDRIEAVAANTIGNVRD